MRRSLFKRTRTRPSRPSRPKVRRNALFLKDSSNNRPRWRQHRPTANWDRLAPSPTAHTSGPSTGGDFLSLSLRRRDSSRLAPETNRAGKATLLLIATLLLVLSILYS